MSNAKESMIEVSLDLNEELRDYAVQRLAQFRTEHRICAANVLCDLPQLNRELCGAVCDHLNAIQYYGMKTKTAEICGIDRKTQYNYEHFIPP